MMAVLVRDRLALRDNVTDVGGQPTLVFLKDLRLTM